VGIWIILLKINPESDRCQLALIFYLEYQYAEKLGRHHKRSGFGGRLVLPSGDGIDGKIAIAYKFSGFGHSQREIDFTFATSSIG
jgi:hypothetical protein